MESKTWIDINMTVNYGTKCLPTSVLRDQFVVIKKNKDFSITVPIVDVKK